MPSACMRQPLRGPRTILQALLLVLVAIVPDAVPAVAHLAGTAVGGPDATAAKSGRSRSVLSMQRYDADASTAGYTASKRAEVVPQCYWNPQEEACDADDAVNIMYAINASPDSVYLWFLLMTFDRETVCRQHTSADTCRSDTAHRCIHFIKTSNTRDETAGNSSSNRTNSSSSSSSSSKSNMAAAAADLPKQQQQQGKQQQQMPEAIPLLDAWSIAPLQGGDAAAALHSQLGRQSELVQQQLREQLAVGHQPPRKLSQNRLLSLAAPAPAAANSSSSSRPAGSSKPVTSSSRFHKPATHNAAAAAAAAAPEKPRVTCASVDLLENYIFTRSSYSTPLQAPLALHCPGSKAHQLLSCMRMPSLAACKASKDCVAIPASADGSTSDMCVSRHVHSLDEAAMKKFTFEAELAEPSAVGSCDGACWMRQAILCNRTASRQACSALPFCRHSSSGLCTPRLYTQDNFGSSVQEYMGECADVDNQRDCEGLQLRLTHKGAYVNWSMPSTPKWRCAVPSIHSLITAEAAASASSARGKQASKLVLEVVGQREEWAADVQAAAAATAAAADAARLVSGKGPMALKQNYFAGDHAQAGSESGG